MSGPRTTPDHRDLSTGRARSVEAALGLTSTYRAVADLINAAKPIVAHVDEYVSGEPVVEVPRMRRLGELEPIADPALPPAWAGGTGLSGKPGHRAGWRPRDL